MEYTVTTPTDLLLLLQQYQCLTIQHIVKLLGKEKTITNIRPKLNKLAQEGLVAIQPLPRTLPMGSAPYVYSLTKQGFRALATTSDEIMPAKLSGVALEHTVSMNDVAVLAHLLTRREPRITLHELRHESSMKKSPIALNDHSFLVPDLFLHFVLTPPYTRVQTEPVGLIFEVDRGTEWAEVIRDKIRKYINFSYGLYQKHFGLESLTIIFLVTAGGKARLKNMMTWLQQELLQKKDEADLFLCAAIDPGKIDPLHFFCDPLFQQPFATSLYPLIEQTSTMQFARFGFVPGR